MAFTFGGGTTNGFGGFGAQPQQQPQNTGFGFGAPAQAPAAAAPAFGGGGFGTTNGFGGFAPQQQQQPQQQPPAFGQPQQQQQQQPQQPLFGSFGQPQAATGFGNFGGFPQQQPQQQQQGFGGVANTGVLAFGGQPMAQQVVVTEETLVKSVGDAFFARAVEVNALLVRLKGERESLERAIKLPPPPTPTASNPAPPPTTSEYDTLLVNTREVLLDQRKALQRTRKRMGVLRGEVDSLSGGLESTRAQGLGVLSRAPASDSMGGGGYGGGYSASEGPPFPSPLLQSFYDTSASRANELLFRLDELRQRLQVSVGEGGGRGEEGMQALLTDVKTTVAKVEGEHLAPLRERVEDMKHRVRLACAEVANNASRSPLWQQQMQQQQQQQQRQQQPRGGGGNGGRPPPEGIHLDPFAAYAKRVERAEQIRLEANRGRLKAAMSPIPPPAAPSTDAPGGGGVGAPTATAPAAAAAAPAAGATAPGAPPAAPAFPMFGANPATAPATNTAFAFPTAPTAPTAPAAPTFGGFGGFGGAAPTTAAATTGGFGAPANTAANPFGFGGGAPPFGAAATTNPFGGFSNTNTNFTSQQPGPKSKKK